MLQVLFRIPVIDLPIYGFGTMLFVALVTCVWLAGRRAEAEGVAKERLQDIALPIFVCGILGARIVYMIQYNQPLWNFFKIWEGGIVFYGSAIGGWVGYGLAYWFYIRKYRLSTWKLADIVAPTVAVGLAIGRIGCYLNGCCYGHVACADCPGGALGHFPALSSAAMLHDESGRAKGLLPEGLQTAAGFGVQSNLTDVRTVGGVELKSAAERAGLRTNDVIVAVDGREVETYGRLESAVLHQPRGKTDLALTVQRGKERVDLPAYVPRTLGLHPTQLYESVSMALLFVLLTAFYPYRRHEGQVFTLLMACYAVHRFFNETLRNDTDPVLFHLTLSQVGSLAVLAAAAVLELWLWRTAARVGVKEPAPAPAAANG
jgi:phosphatidylglycerol---prolipoprotein diacylglyceryl transferase